MKYISYLFKKSIRRMLIKYINIMNISKNDMFILLAFYLLFSFKLPIFLEQSLQINLL